MVTIRSKGNWVCVWRVLEGRHGMGIDRMNKSTKEMRDGWKDRGIALTHCFKVVNPLYIISKACFVQAGRNWVEGINHLRGKTNLCDYGLVEVIALFE